MHILAPLSLLYRAVTDIRNWMFDHGWLEERQYVIPIVCIGNLAVGGTGKTPHCEWLVEHLLEENKRVAILSRGYGRKTKGFVEATAESRADEIGDEPLQLFKRFESKAVVAVCEDRRQGIERLQKQHPKLDIIVLDDAFQHRYVRPFRRLLLTDYSRLYTADHLMPWGRLRESSKGAARADIIIVTKCPADLSAEERLRIVETLKPKTHQQVFFSTMTYAPIPELENTPRARIALLAGIAHPEPFRAHFEEERKNAAMQGSKAEAMQGSEAEAAQDLKAKAQEPSICATLFYADHHNFSASDITRIEATASKVDYIVTTDKDFARLQSLPFSASTLGKIIIQHINVSILGNEKTLLQSLL